MNDINRDPTRGRRSKGGRFDADLLAAQALAFLAADPDRLGQFFATTGVAPAALRGLAAQPGFSTSILGYVAQDEPLLLGLAQSEGIDPERLGLFLRGLVEGPSFD